MDRLARVRLRRARWPAEKRLRIDSFGGDEKAESHLLVERDLCFDGGKSSCEAGRDLRVAPPAHDLEAFRAAREGVGDHEPLLVGEAEVAVADHLSREAVESADRGDPLPHVASAQFN